MKIKLSILCFLYFAHTLSAQSPTCDCPKEFNWLQEKIRTNYPGYKDKITAATQADFERHTNEIRLKTSANPSSDSCLQLLRNWTAWFHDAHMGIQSGASAPEDPALVRARYAQTETIALDETAVKTRLSQPDRDPIEGIYVNDSKAYRVALLKFPGPERDFAAFVLKADSVYWVPGQVKFNLKRKTGDTYDCQYFMRDHSSQNKEVKFDAGMIEILGIGWFAMEYPLKNASLTKANGSGNFEIKPLNEQTLYLRMATMDDTYRWEFENLVKEKQALLDHYQNWIIDVRGNGGGSDVTYYPLRKYLYTKPVTTHRANLYATHDNAEKFRLLSHDHKSTNWYERLYYRHLSKKMERNKGQLIGQKGLGTTKLRGAKKLPLKVVVLQDKGCGSSCEQFVLFAQQSDKVTLMGTNTYGVLDYANVHVLPFNNGQWTLHYPTSRSTRIDEGKGIDNIGIPASVPLQPGTDWLKAAQEFLNKH
ncbi:MAG: S41 family peptidase [Bacteroidota bacterium]